MQQHKPVIGKGIDGILIWLYAIIVIIGLLSIFSVEYRANDNLMQSLLGFKKNYSKQLFYLGACLLLAIFILLTDSKLFTATANLSYLLGILLILATFVVGKEIKGSKSWIPLGFMNLQPVELCKIFTALALSKFMAMPETDFRKPRSQIIAVAIAFAPAAFSIMQGETGLALVYFAFLIPMYREGLPPAYLIIGGAAAVLLVISLLFHPITLVIAFSIIALLFLWIIRRQVKRNTGIIWMTLLVWGFCSLFVWKIIPFSFQHVLKNYQADRIYSLLGVDNPYAFKNVSKAGDKEKLRKAEKQDYNVKQSKIAIGSGGFWGKGFLQGTQTQGDFVPEQHTDFIFTSVGENFGFWGSALLLLLYLGLLFRISVIAERQRSTFSRIYAYGIAGIIFFHVVVNVCVTIGLAPVIGITLPLMSYGGTSLLTFTTLIFVLIKLDADRQMVLR